MPSKTKSLVKSMTYAEASHYCEVHPEWKIPSLEETYQADKTETDWDAFWVRDCIGDRSLIYNHRQQVLRVTHPNFKHNVLLVRS